MKLHETNLNQTGKKTGGKILKNFKLKRVGKCVPTWPNLSSATRKCKVIVCFNISCHKY